MFIIMMIVPIMGAIYILNNAEIIDKKSEEIGLKVSIIPIIISIIVLININNNQLPGYEFISDIINTKQTIEYSRNIGCDGISLIFLLLTVLITPISIMAAEKRTEMIAIMLMVETILIGAFIVMDFIWFYILFEAVLIPMFFLVGGSPGQNPFKIQAAYRLFLYTFGGSILMLLALIIIYLEIGSTNWFDLLISSIDVNKQYLLFPLIFIAFAVKIPLVPLHLWLPEAHVEAPTCGSIILAALLLKLGGYGILRWLLPICPLASQYYSPLIMVISVIGLIYSSLTTLRQIDLKKIIAYSSVAHMSLVVFGIFSLNPIAIEGGIFQMVSHGFVSSGLFLCVGFLYHRHGTRLLKYYRGLASTMPLFSISLFFLSLANIAVPITSSFIGEFLLLAGSFIVSPLLTVIASSSMILSAAYGVWFYNRLCFGSLTPYLSHFKDLNRREIYTITPLLLIVLFLGIFPNFIFDLIHSPVSHLLISA